MTTTPPTSTSTKPTSQELKRSLAGHLYWRLKYPIVCDEFKFIDILGVRSSEYVVEFEIKVSKSDFDREVKCILADVDVIEKYGKDWEKFIKHRIYLTGECPKSAYDLRMESLGVCTNTQTKFRPNEFYFYVPDYLAEYATKKMIELNLPYGVVVSGYEKPNGWIDPHFVMSKAVKLHTEKAQPTLYYQLAHSLTIRGRLFQ